MRAVYLARWSTILFIFRCSYRNRRYYSVVNKAPSPPGIWFFFSPRLIALHFQLQKAHPVISELLLHPFSHEDRPLPGAERGRNLLTATGVVVSNADLPIAARMKPAPSVPAVSAEHRCVLQSRTTFSPGRVIVDGMCLSQGNLAGIGSSLWLEI